MRRLDLSVGQKLSIGSLAVAILVAGLGVFLASSVAKVTELRRSKIELIVPRIDAAESLERTLYQQAVAFRNYAISRSPADLETFRASLRAVDESVETLTAVPGNADTETLITSIRPTIDAHRQAFETFLTMMAAGADSVALREQEAVISSHRDLLLRRVHGFSVIQSQQGSAADRAINAALDRLRITVALVMLMVLVASAITGLLVARSVRGPAGRLIAAAEALQKGEFAPAVSLRATSSKTDSGRAFHDELREAAHVFGRMAATLQHREQRLAAHARLSAVLSASLDPKVVAESALREIAAHIGAEVGAVYLTAGTVLNPVGSIALDADLDPIRVGEGLPGQAAADRSSHLVSDIPADTPFRLRLGIDAVPPRAVLATPMLIEQRVVGVLVLASLHEIDEEAVRFVEQSASHLAVTLDNASAHVRIAGLAAELQEKNETLQLQNEELQAQSEELQSQSEELQSQNEELQAQTEELHSQTCELQSQSEELRTQQAAMAAANARLTAAERQKNEFLAVLGHELRNPLAAISAAESLLDDTAGEDVHRNVHEIVTRQTSHLVRLVDDLLDIGRITSGRILLERRPFELGAVVEQCVKAAIANGASQGPQITLHTGERIWIDGDATRVEQIVTNLLTNAVRYTPCEGKIAVHVARDSEGAIVRVMDDGMGIEAELLPRVFDLFVQGDRRPEKALGGLGVGLSLVKTLVELHGGTVTAESEGAGRGATMTVRLPALVGAPVVAAAEAAVAAKLPIRRSIVLVEDNPDLRRMMKLLLDRSGHSVTEASDGPGAVTAVTSARPDIALIDLDLPGFDGCEVARRIRLDSAMAGVRLIAVSGFGRPEDRERALASGFDDHLVKPVDFGRLAAVLEG